MSEKCWRQHDRSVTVRDGVDNIFIQRMRCGLRFTIEGGAAPFMFIE